MFPTISDLEVRYYMFELFKVTNNNWYGRHSIIATLEE